MSKVAEIRKPAAPRPSEFARRFHVIQRLGVGAHGAVYLAEQVSPGGFRRRVALKVVHFPKGDPRAPTATERAQREARLLGRLHHANVVDVIDLVRLDRADFPGAIEATSAVWAVVMEAIDGHDLAEILQEVVLRGDRVPTRVILEVGATVARALDAAWTADDGAGGQMHVLHRDVKPENIMLTRAGVVKILDFGVAHAGLDETKKIVGTLPYLAPERLRQRSDGPEADVYSLAVTLLELCGGLPEWPDELDDEVEQRWRDEALADAQRTADTTAGGAVLDLIRSAMSADPAQRPSAPAFAEACAALAAAFPGQPSLAEFAAGLRIERPDALRAPTDLVWTEARSFTAEDWSEMGQTVLYVPEPARRSPAVWRLALAVLLLSAVAGGSVARWSLGAAPGPAAPAPLVHAPPAVVEPVVEPVTSALAAEPTPEPEVAAEAPKPRRPRKPAPPPRPAPDSDLKNPFLE